jgi:hypothetical protein
MSDAEETKVWMRAFSKANKMGYDLKECRIFAMAYSMAWNNCLRSKKRKEK